MYNEIGVLLGTSINITILECKLNLKKIIDFMIQTINITILECKSLNVFSKGVEFGLLI